MQKWIISFLLFIFSILLIYSTYKHKDTVLSFISVFRKESQIVKNNEYNELKTALDLKEKSLNETTAKLNQLESSLERVDVVMSSLEFKNVYRGYSLVKPVTAEVNKLKKDSLIGVYEIVNIVGKDYEFKIEVLDEVYGEIVTEKMSLINFNEKLNSALEKNKSNFRLDRLVKKCDKGTCYYGFVYKSKYKNDVCELETLPVGKECFFNYIPFSSVGRKSRVDATFSCKGEDKSKICDQMMKSVKPLIY